MKIFAIGDLHLSTNSNKPMDVFGSGWEGHMEKIAADWRAKVTDDDVVLLAGDTSWAMRLEDAQSDLAVVAPLTGKKIVVRGNHDFWWNGITKLRESAPAFTFLQNDAVKVGKYVFVGSRGWTVPGSPDYTEHDEKLYKREAERFSLALKDGERLMEEGDTLVALLHYPPFSIKTDETLFTQLFERYGVKIAVFGHIHGAPYFPLRCEKRGITYHLVSCDKVGFQLTEITPRA